ncbi:MAG: ornithine carbamoyltransferase [archaeon]
MVRHLLSINDMTKERVEKILDKASELKAGRKRLAGRDALPGKNLAMIFERASTRTRISFDLAITELGGHAMELSPSTLAMSKGESLEDTAHVMERFYDAIMIRTYSHETLKRWASVAKIPIINGLDDVEHPCQAICDMLTVREHFGKLKGLNFVFVGDCDQNMATSLALICGMMGLNFTAACPKEYQTKGWVQKQIKGKINFRIEHDLKKAAKDADVIYTDIWVNPGFEKEKEARLKILRPYQVNEEVAKSAPDDYVFMHCLPANRGQEVTDEVIDSKNSIVFEQAENRLHGQKGILIDLITGL